MAAREDKFYVETESGQRGQAGVLWGVRSAQSQTTEQSWRASTPSGCVTFTKDGRRQVGRTSILFPP